MPSREEIENVQAWFREQDDKAGAENAATPMEQRIHIALMRVAECNALLTENLRQAWRDHPEDEENMESGLSQAAYSGGHLDLELSLLYALFGTTEDALLKDFAESDENLHTAPGSHSHMTLVPIKVDD
jgi:hypothetical protein